VLLASEGVRFVPEVRVYYRVSALRHGVPWIGLAKKLEAQWLAMQMYIQYLRSLEDSDRVRAVCVCYLQNWFPYFIRRQGPCVQLETLALELGVHCTAAFTMEIRLDSKGVWLDIGQACEDDVTAMEGVARTVL